MDELVTAHVNSGTRGELLNAMVGAKQVSRLIQESEGIEEKNSQ